MSESKSEGEDTDAMGKSGALVDFAAEKAEEAKEKVKEVRKGVEGAIEESREGAGR
jgi:signal transduction histidine kinase